jgi:hypothetical protein
VGDYPEMVTIRLRRGEAEFLSAALAALVRRTRDRLIETPLPKRGDAYKRAVLLGSIEDAVNGALLEQTSRPGLMSWATRPG